MNNDLLSLTEYLDWMVCESQGGEIYQVDELNECLNQDDEGDCHECAYCLGTYDIIRLYAIDWEDIEAGLDCYSLSDDDLNLLKDLFSKSEFIYIAQVECYELERFLEQQTIFEYFLDDSEAKSFCDDYFENVIG